MNLAVTVAALLVVLTDKTLMATLVLATRYRAAFLARVYAAFAVRQLPLRHGQATSDPSAVGRSRRWNRPRRSEA